jgi:hypothetical protein
MVSSRPGRLAGSPAGRIVQHLPGGLRGVVKPLAVLGGWGECRRIGHEPVETRQILEVTLRTPNVVTGRGQIGARAHTLGSDHIELEAVADEPVAVPVDVEVFGSELPTLGLQQRRQRACRTGRASSINDGICVGGGRTCRSAGLVVVQHDHERPDERPSTGPMIGDIGNR